jgi:signal transduction histidine kinase
VIVRAWEQSGGSRQSVLVVSDDGDFGRDILGRWQIERQLPAFTLVTSEMCQYAEQANFDLAIIGLVRGSLADLLATLQLQAAPIICVVATGMSPRTFDAEHTSITVLRQREGWVDNLVILAGEILRRRAEQSHLQRAEQLASASQKQAVLGRYMLEMRHNFNNALTSVLGNAELILLDVETLRPELREQVGTIRDMALNLHEMMQRFTSLDLELHCANGPKQEVTPKSRAAGNGGCGA